VRSLITYVALPYKLGIHAWVWRKTFWATLDAKVRASPEALTGFTRPFLIMRVWCVQALFSHYHEKESWWGG